METKTKSWTIPTVLGLVLSVVGALGVIELRPQIAVSPQGELANGQPFSPPFDVTNTGYLEVHVDNVTVVIHKVEYHGKISVTDATIGGVDWDNFDLDRNESKTIVLYLANGQPDKADVVIAVDYKYFGFKGRRLLRFEGIHMDNWDWSKQPIADLEPGIEKVVDKGLTDHYRAIERRKHPN